MARKSTTTADTAPRVTATGHAAFKALKGTGQGRISKRARLKAMLAAPEGATIAEVGSALTWQPHTVRAALSMLRKSGATIARIAPNADGDVARYRLMPDAEGSE